MKQASSKAWSGKSRGGSFGHLFFILVIRYLGVRAAYFHLLFVVPYFVPFAPKATKAIWCYNRHILKYGVVKAGWMILVSYYRFGQTIIDKVAILNGMASRYKFEFDNYDEFLSVLNSGQGVTIIGAHVGSWEVGAPFFDHYGRKINIVMYDAEYQKIKAALEKSAGSRNYKVIPLTDDSLDSIIRIKAAVDSREYVCFQGDRYMSDKNVIHSSFLGADARFPSGPFLVASRLRVPVVFYFAMRERGRKYRFYFRVATPVVRTATQKPEGQLFGQYIKELEAIVSRYPQQWFNFYQFWN
ncbi:acyltransferase [Alistipes sp. ZOR0009]|jgi:predicted LPLAT superfamily acyltransferase|uniref:LpxL/LpxP family acyltransferase n=1 Tax=Alistipes sp. ZOR0009 TaxID=1339253 RepID=UPI000648217F|nr:acyltransferase [Alistipes sp. ZOR0009]